MSFTPLRPRWFVAGTSAILLAAGYAVYTAPDRVPVQVSQFERDSTGLHPDRRPAVEAGLDGNLRYLHDDFHGYAANSRLVNGFDAPNASRAAHAALGRDADAYQGTGSTSADLAGGADPVTVRTDLPAPVDLSRWASGGYLSMWLKVQRGEGLAGVTVTLGDAAGRTRVTGTLPNLQTAFPDFPAANDPFPDLAYPEPTFTAAWTDFRLAPGWNFLPWRLDREVTDAPGLDLTRITWCQVAFTTTGKLRPQRLLLDDLRVQDGLQLAHNPTAGNWRPPLGMPQYGVYDVDGGALHLLNVRQTQYASNGDRGRMLTSGGTPKNFALRTRFTLDRLGADLSNTWLRLMYDFDPSYDPGHDWFGAYLSLQYHRFGLLTVVPVERFAIQAQEPTADRLIGRHRTGVEPRAGVTYELDLTVRGQAAEASLYEVRGGRLYGQARVAYTFHRPRYVGRAYPLGIEITGNVKATVYDVEMVRL